MQTEVLTGRPEVEAVASEWQRLFSDARPSHPFASWEWYDAWLRHHGDVEPRVVLVRDDEGLAALAPLVRSPGRPATLGQARLHVPGDTGPATYTDLLVARRGVVAVDHIVAALADRDDWGVLELPRVPDASRALGALVVQAWQGDRPGDVTLEDACPVVSTGGDHDEYLARLEERIVKRAAYSERKLAREEGEVAFEVVPGDDHEARRALFEHHLQRQRRRRGTSVFATRRDRAFFADLVRRHPHGWQPEFAVLSAGDRPVAVSLGFATSTRRGGWLMAYDGTIKGASLGPLLAHRCIEHAFASDTRTFDMMLGADPYKLKWATDVEPVWRVALYANQGVRAAAQVRHSGSRTLERLAVPAAEAWRRRVSG